MCATVAVRKSVKKARWLADAKAWLRNHDEQELRERTGRFHDVERMALFIDDSTSTDFYFLHDDKPYLALVDRDGNELLRHRLPAGIDVFFFDAETHRHSNLPRMICGDRESIQELEGLEDARWRAAEQMKTLFVS